MKNYERQQRLDKKKWFLSIYNCEDMSGQMPYCDYCEFNGGVFNQCTLPQEDRETNCICAKAYNRMVKKK